MAELKCGNCKWWKKPNANQYAGLQGTGSLLGNCQRYPKGFGGSGAHVPEHYFCGEHSNIPDPIAEAVMDLTAVLRELFEGEIDPDAELQRHSDLGVPTKQ